MAQEPKTNPEPSYEHSEQEISFWKLIIAVVLTALIVGGGMYIWCSFSMTKNEQQLQLQINQLKQEFNQLKQQKEKINEGDSPQEGYKTQNGESNNLESSQEQSPAEKKQTIDINGWQKYTNAKYGYAIQYPEEFVFNDKKLDSILFGDDGSPYFSVTVFNLNTNKTLKQQAEEQVLEIFSGVLNKQEIEWLEVGHNRVSIKFPSQAGAYTGNVVWDFFVHQGKVYRILAFSGYKEKNQIDFQKQIVSGFEFLD